MSAFSSVPFAALDTISVSLDSGPQGVVSISAEIHNSRILLAQNSVMHLLHGDMPAVSINDGQLQHRSTTNPCNIFFFFQNAYLAPDSQSYYCLIKNFSISTLDLRSDIIIEAMDLLRAKAIEACIRLNKETNSDRSFLNIILGLSSYCGNVSPEMIEDIRMGGTSVLSKIYMSNDLIASGLQFERVVARYCPSNRFLVTERFEDSFQTYLVSIYSMTIPLNSETRANPRKKKLKRNRDRK